MKEFYFTFEIQTDDSWKYGKISHSDTEVLEGIRDRCLQDSFIRNVSVIKREC